MRNIIVGTAGHIDHGKTTLIKALTGVETDRWEEEKKRGITIDLGFAYLDLDNGNRLGIIDVPGHEKFIKNMVAGVIGMDLVMLVIAADEGIMPQTSEHINILNLLGVRNGIVVLTKCDTVDEEWLELVKEDIKEELSDTFLAESPFVEVSSITGQGIDELKKLLIEKTDKLEDNRDVDTIVRLPIDRSFTISGFGTVITGTLVSGSVKKGEELEVFPIEKNCKVRNIQVHGEDKDEAFAGQRVAVNIANIKKNELYRGCVIAPKKSMKKTMMIDVKLDMLKSSSRIIENRSRLHLYTGTSEVLCRVVLLDKEVLTAGESCYAQLRLEEEIAVRTGDKYVVRFYSPMETVGGGSIIEPVAKKAKRFDDKKLKSLAVKEKGNSKDIMENLILENSEFLPSIGDIAKIAAVKSDEVLKEVLALETERKITVFRMKNDTCVWHKEYEDDKTAIISKFISDFHKQYPYKLGVKKAEIKSKFFKDIKQIIYDEIIQLYLDKSIFKMSHDILSVTDFDIIEDEKFTDVKSAIMQLLDSNSYDTIRLTDIMDLGKDKQSTEDVLSYLIDMEIISKIADETYVLTSIIENIKNEVESFISKNGKISAGEFRDIFDTNRKFAISVLEYLDGIKFTKRIENDRILMIK